MAKAPELDVNRLIRISADFVLGKKDITALSVSVVLNNSIHGCFCDVKGSS